MELRHLRYFVAVAEEEHVTRAAKRLGIQQPPLSQQIRALEEELEVQLFRRRRRGIELTDAGRAFFEDARAILEHTGRAKATAQRTARGQLGKLALGTTLSSSLNAFVPEVIRTFCDGYPDVALDLKEGLSEVLINQVAAETLDAAFIRSKVREGEGVVGETVVEEPIVAAVPEGHKLASGGTKAVPLPAFRDESLILSRRQVGGGGLYAAIYDAIVDAFQAEGLTPPPIAQESAEISTALNLVASGVGVTLVPASMRNFQTPGVRFLDLDHSPESHLVASIYLAFRPTGLSATARNFVQLVRRHARS